MRIKVALPKGRLLDKTAALLQEANWGLDGYNKELRLYHIKTGLSNLAVKVFHEKDIPVQVAIGNYDLGICGLDWIEELLAKYPSSALLKVKDLGFGETALYMTASPLSPQNLEQLKTSQAHVRIASEYPNLAEAFALKNRFSRFSVFPVWGAAEAFPPENADLALISGKTEFSNGMVLVSRTLDSSAYLIANRNSWESKDLFEVVSTIPATATGKKMYPAAKAGGTMPPSGQSTPPAKGVIRLALPDGHQQEPTIELLTRAGVKIEDYPSPTGNRRPKMANDIIVKVIRPQDMPMQLANGNFDLAITGHDWLTEHLYQFPSSPVKELLDLKFGWVKLVAVVSESLEVADVPALRQLICTRPVPLRVASEYTNIADKYARDNHLGPYRVVPTWGATEAFLPDDADMLIENTQTGGTIARHKLKIIDTLFESTACLAGNLHSIASPDKRSKVKAIIETLRKAVG